MADGNFQQVTACCKRKCYEIYDEDTQSEIYARFQRCTTKEAQDVFLNSCMKWDAVRQRMEKWSFTVVYDSGIDVVIRKTCFKKLFQVQKNTLTTLR